MKPEKKFRQRLRELTVPLVIALTFWAVAIILWKTSGKVFYLFNFGYIGTAVGFGIGLYVLLPRKNKPIGRRVAQLLIGIYMLGYLGLVNKENMQIEGFFFYLMSGVFGGAVIHYLVAKVTGPILYGRGYCAWSCWTAMVLDFLPFKQNPKGRLSSKWESLRYIHFCISLALVLVLWFLFQYRSVSLAQDALVWLIARNAIYYCAAIALALTLKDNRAFCKYLCPITVILKATSRFSFLKIEGNKEECTQCGACNRACPMDIDIMEYVRNDQRVLSTECIFCMTCTTVCPAEILKDTFQMDVGGQEHIRRRDAVRKGN